MIIIENSGSSNSTTMRITMIFNILISRIRTIILTCIVSVLPNFIIVTDRILRSSVSTIIAITITLAVTLICTEARTRDTVLAKTQSMVAVPYEGQRRIGVTPDLKQHPPQAPNGPKP